MNALQTAGAGRVLRSAGVMGLYGGSLAIAAALITAGFEGGSAGQVAGMGTGAVVNALVNIMSTLGALLR